MPIRALPHKQLLPVVAALMAVIVALPAVAQVRTPPPPIPHCAPPAPEHPPPKPPTPDSDAAPPRAERNEVWSEGSVTAGGVKTRRFDDVMSELEGFFATCRAEGAWPGGVHLEFTGEDVTECLGGADALLEEELCTRYETLCDPRLNARQSLDLAFRLSELLRGA